MKKLLIFGLALACVISTQAHARLTKTHAFISGTFKDGTEVTKLCLKCHELETKQIMKTVHWNWSKKQSLNGKTVDYGKRNALSNACGMLPSNWQGCTNCHAGYGWRDGSFDFSKPENVDCLVCHETTGTYKKIPGGAGHPAYSNYSSKEAAAPVNLTEVARSVERPSRAACGSCHFYGGGGDNAKHGDLDSSLANPTPETDVHMGKMNFTCESCHKAPNHDVRGEAVSVSLSSGPRTMACTDCHTGRIHPAAALNMHLKRIACQTCHIPTFAREIPTLMRWDWSKPGKEAKPGERKGEMTFGKNLKPTLFWYNGSIERVMMGDQIDPASVVKLTAPKGERSDPNSRIFPFKVLTGKQPYDVENRTIAVVNVFGTSSSAKGYWYDGDLGKGIKEGMKGAGLPYSGKFGYVETSTVWAMNHMVAPKAQALSCPNCHVQGGRIDWNALGYPQDPR